MAPSLVAPADAVCRLCGEAIDESACHGLCSARAESSREHFAVVASLVDGMAPVDPGVRTEMPGLVPSAERPADILTAAGVPGIQTAMDVTVGGPKFQSC